MPISVAIYASLGYNGSTMKVTMQSFYRNLSTETLVKREADAVRDLKSNTVTIYLLAKTREMTAKERKMTQEILNEVTAELNRRKVNR